MAEKTVQDDARARERIIQHMNNDHHDSVVRYLQHYGKIPSWKAYDGKVSGVDLKTLTLYCHGSTIRVPFEPPLHSYREARERVVEFDKTCRQALGQSDVTVKQYLAPSGLYALPFIVIIGTMLAYSQRWWFEEGQPLERLLGSSFAKFS